MIAVDTNILVYAHRQDTEHHKNALKTLRTLAEGDKPWALPVFCLGEFIRVVTHQRIFKNPTPLARALSDLSLLLASPSVEVLYPGEQFWSHFQELCLDGNTTGNLVFDSQIAALLREYGISEILSYDRDFARFPFLRLRRN